MKDIKFLFYKPKNICGYLISWQTRGKYSHVSCLLNNKIIIESIEKNGVIERNINGLDLLADIYILNICIQQEKIENIQKWLLNQVGKKYDWLAILRFLSRRKMQNNNKWFCSELCYCALLENGISLLNNTECWEVSPTLLSRSPILSKVD